jgi:hypothetical protein
VNGNSNYLRETLDLLSDDRLPLIDFDRLRECLKVSAQMLDEADSHRQNVSVLRGDYEGRIAGMLKAIAAVDRKNGGIDEALKAVESLGTLTGEELVNRYRRTAARFRDAFPTSFGFLNGTIARRPERLNEYKS